MLNGVFIRLFPVQMCSMAFAVLEFHFYCLLVVVVATLNSIKKIRTMSN